MTDPNAPFNSTRPPESPAPAPGQPGGVPGLVSAESDDAKTMALLCHLLAIFGFLAPLIIWLVKKDQSPFVNQEGKESLNFQLTLLIAYVVGGVTACLIIGFFILAAASIADIVFCILAATTVNKGQPYRYPVCIRFIK
jgi:hypothetical protein